MDKEHASTSSSEELGDETTNESDGQWQPDTQSGQVPSARDDSDPCATQPSNPLAPIQKRRRVTRACDECRRKKIKCDGLQPCTHCTIYSYGKYMTCVSSNQFWLSTI